MTSKNFFLFQAFVGLAYGIPLLLVPEFFIALLRGEEKSSGWITILLTAILLVWSGLLLSKDKGLVLQ